MSAGKREEVGGSRVDGDAPGFAHPMTVDNDGTADGESAVQGAPSEQAQGNTRTDAADPEQPQRQREHRVGSAGGGPYPLGWTIRVAVADRCGCRGF